jgi:hypothetical protein
VVSLLAAGVLGWLVNDSGVVITALSFVFIGPFLTLIVLADRAPGPELLLQDPSGHGSGTTAGHPLPARGESR